VRDVPRRTAQQARVTRAQVDHAVALREEIGAAVAEMLEAPADPAYD